MNTEVYIYEQIMTPPPLIIFLMTVAAILFLKDPSQKLIRSSEIPGEQLYQI